MEVGAKVGSLDAQPAARLLYRMKPSTISLGKRINTTWKNVVVVPAAEFRRLAIDVLFDDIFEDDEAVAAEVEDLRVCEGGVAIVSFHITGI